jgi:hypothetical protein
MGLEQTRPVQARRGSGVGSSSRIQYTPSAISTRTSSGIDPVWTSRRATGPPETRSRRRSKLGLQEDGTMRRSVADRRLHGGHPVDRPRPISPFLTTGGVNPQEGTHTRELFSILSRSRNLRPANWWLRQVERKPPLLRRSPITDEPEFGSRSSIRRGCWDWLRLWWGNLRTRSPLPRLDRL